MSGGELSSLVVYSVGGGLGAELEDGAGGDARFTDVLKHLVCFLYWEHTIRRYLNSVVCHGVDELHELVEVALGHAHDGLLAVGQGRQGDGDGHSATAD